MIAVKDGAGDAQLMGDVSAGSLDAFAQLYDRYCHRAYRVALSVCRDEGRAQDAVQEAFLAVWKSRTSYLLQQGTVAAWLLTIVRHRAIDLDRKNDKHAAHRASDESLEHHAGTDDFTETTVSRDDADRLTASLALLPTPSKK
jgi:RNA polymerase sigma-70 factor (ECF subfamily)